MCFALDIFAPVSCVHTCELYLQGRMRYVDTGCQRERLIKTAHHLLCTPRTLSASAPPVGRGKCHPERRAKPEVEPVGRREASGSLPPCKASTLYSIVLNMSTHPPQAVPQVCTANFQDAMHPYSHHKGRLITAKAQPNFRYRLLATKRALNCVLRKFIARQTESPTFAIVRALHMLMHSKKGAQNERRKASWRT